MTRDAVVTHSASAHQWDKHYRDLPAPFPYGDSITYRWAAEWCRDCEITEEWGCGPAWMRQFFPEGSYFGVDASCSPFADAVDDAATRVTHCDAVVMRHLLEHLDNWGDVLQNAMKCAQKRLFVALFTPLEDVTQVRHREPDYGDVPVISFCIDDIVEPLHRNGWIVDVQTIESPQGSVYGVETAIRAERALRRVMEPAEGVA